MPLKPGTTADDIIRHVCVVATAPRRAREAGLCEDGEQQLRMEIDASNFGVFVLRAAGLELDGNRREQLWRLRASCRRA